MFHLQCVMRVIREQGSKIKAALRSRPLSLRCHCCVARKPNSEAITGNDFIASFLWLTAGADVLRCKKDMCVCVCVCVCVCACVRVCLTWSCHISHELTLKWGILYRMQLKKQVYQGTLMKIKYDYDQNVSAVVLWTSISNGWSVQILCWG